MKNKILLLAAAIFLLAANCFADTIVLKSGKTIDGTILSKDNDSVKVDFGGFSSTYFFDEIESINGEKIAEPASGITSDVMPEINTEAPQEEAPVMPPVYNEGVEILKHESAAAEMATVATIVVIVLIIFILAYVYSSICLQFIAKKTSQEYPWLAWIPVANLFLMCKIGGISYWWILIILASFIPIVGMFIDIAFFGFVWYKIAIARNKPGWIGALGGLPLINAIVWGYLAFSE